MALTTLIALNAGLGAAVVTALLVLLGHGIRSDRRAHAALAEVLGARTPATERLAA